MTTQELIESISGYLPYKLYMQVKFKTLDELCNQIGNIIGKGFRKNDVKFILRPMTDLSKEIIVNGYNNNEPFIPAYIFTRSKDKEIQKQIIHDICKSPFLMRHWIINLLYQWHFDVHGLIEKGYAIDANLVQTK